MAVTPEAVLAGQVVTADPVAVLSWAAASREEEALPAGDAITTGATVAADAKEVSMGLAEVAAAAHSDAAAVPDAEVVGIVAATAIMMLSMRTCFSIGTKPVSRTSVRTSRFIEFRR